MRLGEVPEHVRSRGREALDPLVRLWFKLFPVRTLYPTDFTPEEVALCAAVAPFTMTGAERIIALANATRYVVENQVPGAIVECGVWRGGSMMAVAKTLLSVGAPPRELVLFDTFEGMTRPGAADRDVHGKQALDILAATPRRPDFAPRVADPSRYSLAPANATFNMWCIASEAEVAANLKGTGYPMEHVQLVRGKVEDTIPNHAPDVISILRLDTDWYESTRHELEHLYERIAHSGVLIIDDYGHWEGARRAVDEFFERLSPRPLLHRIDFTGRCCIKP